ncbi:MAG TPA: hypothetical protein PKD85_18195 [Saprospiraceae bacterium]|nr:hypothetical protein [Saprospiraceae bacterium]
MHFIGKILYHFKYAIDTQIISGFVLFDEIIRQLRSEREEGQNA